jgi:DNA-binding CsgD family transcriptional regulator
MAVSSDSLRALIDGLAELYASPAYGEYPSRVIRVVSGLVPAESCSYNEMPATGPVTWQVDPPDVGAFRGGADAFRQHLPEHPVLKHHQQTGSGEPRRISDFLSDRQFRGLGIYRDFYRYADTDYQTAFMVPRPGGGLIAVALNRVQHDFTDEHLEVLDLLRPHIGQAAATAALLRQPVPGVAEEPGGKPLLTPRQTHILELVAAGHPDRSIARMLGISTRTVHAHLQHTYRVLNVASRTEALAQLRELASARARVS